MKRARICYYVFVLALLIAGIVGCHTIEGLGRDIEKGGEKIQDVVK